MSEVSESVKVPLGLLLARWAGVAAALVMLALVLFRLATGAFDGFFSHLYAGYQIFYALIVFLPFHLLHDQFKLWLPAFILLVITTVIFVFLTVAYVMFAYIEAAEAGERLRLPGFRSTLIFAFLLQIPAVLFHRKPDALE